MVKVVLFDLDDTLFDHHSGSRAALASVQGCHASFRAMPFAALEQAHARLLDDLHAGLMLDWCRSKLPAGALPRLFAMEAAGDLTSSAGASTLPHRYARSTTRVAGAAALLQLVKTGADRIVSPPA